MAAFGDSFAFGYGVDDRDCFTEHCAGLAVKSPGCPAHSMVHGVLQMREVADRLRGRSVVWLVYCGNDLSDNLRPNLGPGRMPFVRCGPAGTWQITVDHVSPDPWAFGSTGRDNDRLFAEMCLPSAFQQRVFAAADHLVGEAAALCRDVGATLTVLSIPPTLMVKDPAALAALASRPQQVDLAEPDRYLAACCATHAVGFLTLLSRLGPDHYWADDMHWNPRGHRVVAEAVTEVHAAGR